jgi:hypothetical protein
VVDKQFTLAGKRISSRERVTYASLRNTWCIFWIYEAVFFSRVVPTSFWIFRHENMFGAANSFITTYHHLISQSVRTAALSRFRKCLPISLSLIYSFAKLSPCPSHWYRLIDKYMRQPRLMRMHRTFIHNFLSSEVASITFTHFLNSSHPSLKYALNSSWSRSFKIACRDSKLVLVSQLNPFEFFFDCRKQAEVTRGQVNWIRWVWHAENVLFFRPICWNPTCVKRPIVEMNHN